MYDPRANAIDSVFCGYTPRQRPREWTEEEWRDILAGVDARIARIRSTPCPVQGDLRGPSTACSWPIAEKAWVVYCRNFGGSGTVERIAERGGLSYSEMDACLPGWQGSGQ